MVSILNHSRLRAVLARTKARLTRLALFDAFCIPAAIAVIFGLAIATGALGWLSTGARALVIYLGFALLIVSLIRGVRRYRPPSKDEVRSRLDATDPQRPLSGLEDRPAQLSAQTRAYWNKHQESLQAAVLTLEPPVLSADWKSRDPFLLRFIAPLLLFAGLALNFGQLPSRFGEAFRPDIGALFGAESLEISAWLTPPEHTGEAPVFLTSLSDEILIPTGSTLTFRVHGDGAPVLKRKRLGDQRLKGPKTIPMKKFVDGSYQVEIPINSSQEISLHYWGKRASWQLMTEADQLPEVRFVTGPAPGDKDQLTFNWAATDDYGLAGMALVITTTDDSGVTFGQTDRVSLDLPGQFAKSSQDSVNLDLTRHKWAGLPVRVMLEATDTGGQTGVSDNLVYILPEKLFLEPMAKSSQEIRLSVMREEKPYSEAAMQPVPHGGEYDGLGDRLEAAPKGVQRAALMLDAVTYRPDIFIDDMTVYLGLRRTYEMLRNAKAPDELEPVDDLLWSVALRAEYGTLADAARRLEAARRALESALRDGAGEDEIRRLMQAYREAAEDYIAARMAEAIMKGGSDGNSGEEPPDMLGGQDLEDMLAALEDLTETGATDAARQLLDDVSNLLNNLQFQQGQAGKDGLPGEPGENGEQDEGTEEEQALQGALDRLGDILEEQRRLNDDTLQERYGTGQPDPDAPPTIRDDPNSDNTYSDEEGDGETGGGTPGEGEEGSLADRQFRLLDELQAFSEELERDGGNGSGLTAEELEQARRAIGRAGNALERGDLDTAQWNQDRAVQALRDAAGELAGELDEQRQTRRGENGSDTTDETDPLGRPAGGTRQDDGEGVTIPEEAERQRARDILDDLRKRLNESTDEEEREYLKRLLDRF